MADGADKFVWPPGKSGLPRVHPPPGSGSTVHTKAGLKKRLGAAWLEIERTWLGLETPPMMTRMMEAGWAPDGPTAYCRRCGATVGMHESDDTGCSHCRGRKFPWERMVRLGEFSGLLREMVLEVKFTRWRRLGDDLGRLLGEALGPVLEAEQLRNDRTVLVPVPISTPRRLRRGIDHAEVIARGAGAVLGVPVVQALRRKHGPALSRLPASRRRANIAGAFSARAGVDLRDVDVIVLDDVTTSRATLTGACRALEGGRKGLGEKAEGRILTAVLGVTPHREGRPWA